MTRAGAVTETSLIAATDAGMHALWNPSRFTGITSYQAWEDALLEDDDITGHVRAGELVPVSIGGDGAFQFLVRVGTPSQAPVLTSREKQHLLVSSQAYLYLSDGSAFLTGIEHVCAVPSPGTPALTIPAGPNAVTIHLINWAAEPGAADNHGKPAAGALPDFVVLISPDSATGNPYRTQLQTFDRGYSR
jgi:hypothetical protein